LYSFNIGNSELILVLTLDLTLSLDQSEVKMQNLTSLIGKVQHAIFY